MAYLDTLICNVRPAYHASLSTLRALSRSRRALSALSADQLKDICVSRENAQDEANRPLWDVPTNWRN